ncbi:hypothetical protein Agub_g6926 [Astrephomene gubernaculifera]|uniref:Pyrroline-5-carboxylate reductase n=1 Tax=Astrephomene gubernaculifera TaxID=47775 RepID=A0AAD3DRU9_9CHLO|nr:hypothetical protein Agub_g6926 [Astrephomene gubernaculifera]
MLQIFRVVASVGSHGFRHSSSPFFSLNKAARRGSAGVCWPPVPPVKLTEEQSKSRQHTPKLIIIPAVGESPSTMATSATSVLDKRIGFLGSGQMAEALARGLIKRGLITADQIVCNDPNPVRKELFRSFGATPYDSNADVARHSDVLFVAVKPQHVSQVLSEVRPVLGEGHTVVSIAAGITVEKLVEAAGPDARVVRVMPNTPCLVGETAAAMCLGGKATCEDEVLVRRIFEAVGRIYTVDEKLLAAVTGLSGSGPAYVFMAIEALADGGVRAGLPRDIAQALAAQTVLGSAKMVLETGSHPGALKDMVTSPGGTTIAGVHELEKAGVRAAFMSAVVAATERANQLAKS